MVRGAPALLRAQGPARRPEELAGRHGAVRSLRPALTMNIALISLLVLFGWASAKCEYTV